MPVDADRLARLDAEWRRINRPFELNGYRGPFDGPEFVIDGSSRVVMSAVHGVVHTRGPGGAKRNDANTGGLVLSLAAEFGLTSAVATRTSELVDANCAPDHPLKRALAPAVGAGTVLIDVHGMSDGQGADVAVGRGPVPHSSAELADLLVACLRGEGLVVDEDGSLTGLTAASAGTMTAWAQRRGAEAVQVELALRVRSFRSPRAQRRSVLAAFVEFLTSLLDGR